MEDFIIDHSLHVMTLNISKSTILWPISSWKMLFRPENKLFYSIFKLNCPKIVGAAAILVRFSCVSTNLSHKLR